MDAIMITLPTQNDLITTYLTTAQGKAQELGLSIDVSLFSDFQLKASAVAGMGSGIVQEATRLFQNTIPQYADSLGINLGLANSNLPPIFPATSAILTLTANNLIANKTYIINVGTIITAPNGATYSVINVNNSSQVILTTVYPKFYASSTATGLNTTQSNSTILTFTPPIISTDLSSTLSECTVISSVDGTNQESIASATVRLIQVKQEPLCSDRASDFKKLAIDPSNNVTDAIVLINNQLTYSNPQLNVGIFDVSGTPITDDILNQGLFVGTIEVVYSRTSSLASVAYTQNIMNKQDIIGAFPNVSTVSTQQITTSNGSNPFFQIKVTLQTGYTLSSEVSLNDNIFTVQQLIQREVRRAVCGQTYGATLAYNLTNGSYISSSLTISSIEQQLDTSLGTATTIGTIGSFLLNRTVLCYNSSTSSYEYLPSISLNLGIPVASNDTLPWVYDISTTVGEIYINIAVVNN